MWVEKHGPTWRIRDLVAGRKVTLQSGYATKTAANGAMHQAESDKLRGDALVPRGGRMTLLAWLDIWWPPYVAGLKPSARISSEGILRRYIRPMLGPLALEDITPLAVQQWTADLLAGKTLRGKPLSVKTVRNAHGQLHTIMAGAVDERLIRQNPCERRNGRRGLPARQHHEMRFLDHAEAGRLVAATPPHFRALIIFFLGTGVRFSEAAGLRVGHIDILARTVRIETQLQELADHAELVAVDPKSRMSIRTLGITPDMAAALIPLVSGRERDELVFRAAKGGMLRYRPFWKIWQRIITAAGLPGLRIHDLRHTHAAWLISDGVPLTAVQRRLGHASISVTSDRYGHLLGSVDPVIDDAVKKAMGMINFGGDVGGLRPETTGDQLNTAESLAGQRDARPADQG